jgi:hypothetical protein
VELYGRDPELWQKKAEAEALRQAEEAAKAEAEAEEEVK